jgi:hypothetical protein
MAIGQTNAKPGEYAINAWMSRNRRNKKRRRFELSGNSLGTL